MWNRIRAIYRWAISDSKEPAVVLSFVVRSRDAAMPCRVLDVGCGYGRYLRWLGERGFEAVGVDANAEVVQANRAAGLTCRTPEELAAAGGIFDVVLMCHVIEHFRPDELISFMDQYLDRLRPGGHLVVATPLLSSSFYDDFDHVRPYQPIGLDMVFGDRTAQVQYYARNRLQLKDLWFRRSPWRPAYVRARYIRSPMTRVVQLAELGAALAFRLTGGLLGRTDGWVGLFQKANAATAVPPQSWP
jgi:SAM-dependent methyltransferase